MVSVRVAKLADRIDCADCPLTVNYPACREFPHSENGRLSVEVFPMLNSRDRWLWTADGALNVAPEPVE